MLHKRNILFWLAIVTLCFVGIAPTMADDNFEDDFDDDWILLDYCINEEGYMWVLLCDLAALDIGWICLGNLWSLDAIQSTLNPVSAIPGGFSKPLTQTERNE